MTLDTNNTPEQVPNETEGDPIRMSDRALLVELVIGQREIIEFIGQVAKGMNEFAEQAKTHPVLRMFLGGNGK